VDALLREINDVDTGEIYPALSCYNNEEIAARCHDRTAKKVIWGHQRRRPAFRSAP
jgi:hypothetical protein